MAERKTSVIAVRMTPRERTHAERLAEQRGTTVSDLVRILLWTTPDGDAVPDIRTARRTWDAALERALRDLPDAVAERLLRDANVARVEGMAGQKLPPEVAKLVQESVPPRPGGGTDDPELFTTNHDGGGGT